MIFRKMWKNRATFPQKAVKSLGKTVLNLQNTFLSGVWKCLFFSIRKRRGCVILTTVRNILTNPKKWEIERCGVTWNFREWISAVVASFEEVAGYSRIVKADPFVFVSGTTAVTPEGTVYGEGDPYAQAKYIFDKTGEAAGRNGVSKGKKWWRWISGQPVLLIDGNHKSLFGIFQGKPSVLHLDWD